MGTRWDERRRILEEIELSEKELIIREMENKKIASGALDDESIIQIIKLRRIADNIDHPDIDEYVNDLRSSFRKYPRGNFYDSRASEGFLGLYPLRAKIQKLHIELLLLEIGATEKLSLMLQLAFRNPAIVGIPGILTMLTVDRKFFKLEQQNKEKFWERIFNLIFPEYLGQIAAINKSASDVFSWKKLCLWMQWAHGRVIRMLEDVQPVFVARTRVIEDSPTGEIDIAYVNWFGEIITRREFAEKHGFVEGRLLSFMASHYSRTNPALKTTKARQQAKMLDNIRQGMLYPFVLRATVDDPVEYKFEDMSNTPLGASMMGYLVEWASDETPANKRDIEFMGMFMKTGTLDTFPRHNRTGRVNVGCAACPLTAVLECSNCLSGFCSQECGAHHVNEKACL